MNDLIDSLYIVAVFSFVTIFVNSILNGVAPKLGFYLGLFILTFLQKKGR